MTDNLPAQPLPKPKEPLDVLLDDMNFWAAKAKALGAQLDALVVDANSVESERRALDLVRDFIAARKRAVETAALAAPYVHGRINPSDAKPAPADAARGDLYSAVIATTNQQDATKAYMRLVQGKADAAPPPPEPKPQPSSPAAPPEPPEPKCQVPPSMRPMGELDQEEPDDEEPDAPPTEDAPEAEATPPDDGATEEGRVEWLHRRGWTARPILYSRKQGT